MECGKCGSTNIEEKEITEIDEDGKEFTLPDLIEGTCLDCGFEFLIAEL